MTDAPTPAADPAVAPSRRSVLAGAAAVGAIGTVGALAGCADDGGAQPRTPSEPTTGESRPAGVITETADVPVGGGRVVVLADTKVVVTQPVEGTFKAFSAICTHAGCTVANVSNGKINCPCHGSQFDAATGETVRGANGSDPSQQSPLAVVDIAVEDGTVTFA